MRIWLVNQISLEFQINDKESEKLMFMEGCIYMDKYIKYI